MMKPPLKSLLFLSLFTALLIFILIVKEVSASCQDSNCPLLPTLPALPPQPSLPPKPSLPTLPSLAPLPSVPCPSPCASAKPSPSSFPTPSASSQPTPPSSPSQGESQGSQGGQGGVETSSVQGETSTATKEGEILGAAAMAPTGNFNRRFGLGLQITGLSLIVLGTLTHVKKKKT